MEDLILSISKEPTDETRRTRLGQVFAEALARPNGAPKRFSDLFDQTLISVGDEVRGKAIAKALQLQESAEPADDTTTNTTPAEKSVEELQVWALVDMMVQSKTIVKKSSGDLGNKGTFA